MLARTNDATSIFLPVVDGVWIRRYAALQDRLAATCLTKARRWHRYLWSNWQPDKSQHFTAQLTLSQDAIVDMHDANLYSSRLIVSDYGIAEFL